MAESTAKRRQIKPVWIIFVLIGLCVALFFYQLFGPDPKISVSKATTYITEPLGEDGLPDFEAYLFEHGSQGVTHENNAAVPFWKALWPGELEQKHWLAICVALDIPDVPSEKESLVPPYDSSVRQQIAKWLAEQYVKPADMDEARWQERLSDQTAHSLIDEAMGRPWTSEQIPPLAEWVESNKKPLDLLLEAGSRPVYFSPSPSLINGSDDSLIALLLPDIQNMRTAARALSVRAMYHLGEDRPQEAWEDLLACHRLARHSARNPTVVGQLVAIAIDGLACERTQILLHHADLSEPLAQQILTDLGSLSKNSDVGWALDQGERLSFVDACVRIAMRKDSISGLLGTKIGGTATNTLDSLLSRSHINWNAVLKTGNLWYDRLVAAAQLPGRNQRTQQFNRVYTELDLLIAAVREPSGWLGGVFSRDRRSELVANFMLGLLVPALQAASSAEDRGIVLSELTRLSAALAVYRAQHQQYPNQLDALVPEILPELPLDLYSGKPFFYQRKADGGYLLYSVFENGVDDGGTHYSGEIVEGEWVDEQPEDFDYANSDVVIRVPVPPLKMPKPLTFDAEW